MSAYKIATCCYCGTRAALVLRGTDRHELSCSNCGAPLHDLKMLRKESAPNARKTDVHRSPKERVKPRPIHPKRPHPKAARKREYKKRKGKMRDFFEEVFDTIEDIFD